MDPEGGEASDHDAGEQRPEPEPPHRPLGIGHLDRESLVVRCQRGRGRLVEPLEALLSVERGELYRPVPVARIVGFDDPLVNRGVVVPRLERVAQELVSPRRVGLCGVELEVIAEVGDDRRPLLEVVVEAFARSSGDQEPSLVGLGPKPVPRRSRYSLVAA